MSFHKVALYDKHKQTEHKMKSNLRSLSKIAMKLKSAGWINPLWEHIKQKIN